MRIGLFTATGLDTKPQEVCELAPGLSCQAVELPASAGDAHGLLSLQRPRVRE